MKMVDLRTSSYMQSYTQSNDNQGNMSLKIKIKDIHDVCGSVWLATAILTYEKYLKIQQQGKKYNDEDFAFKQTEIQKLASEICSKTVQNARISQWCNADHIKNSYNYLRAVGKERRLTISGECNGENEIPDDLLSSDEVIFEVPSHNLLVTFSELIDWVKNDFMNLLNAKPVKKDEAEKGKTNISKPTIKNRDINIPSAEECLKNVPIDFIKLILQTSFWVKKDVFDFIAKNSKINAQGVFYPYTIRKRGSELQSSTPRWEKVKEDRRFLDLNHKPQNALSYSLVGKSFQAAFSDYTCCHIYGGEYSHDWKCFTCVGNMILVPKTLQSLTDHHGEVINYLKQIAFLKYDWKPDNQEIVIEEKTKELLEFTNEIDISLDHFKTVWNRELDKHRASYRKKFNEDPDF